MRCCVEERGRLILVCYKDGPRKEARPYRQEAYVLSFFSEKISLPERALVLSVMVVWNGLLGLGI